MFLISYSSLAVRSSLRLLYRVFGIPQYYFLHMFCICNDMTQEQLLNNGIIIPI